MRPEQTELRLGFVALVDCAPLVVAKARGLFANEGLDVTLSREVSWANVRDRLAAGLLDGAHMLGPMALAQSLGLGGEATPIVAPLALNLGGSAITVSRDLAEAMAGTAAASDRPLSARAVKRLADARRRAGREPLTFGVVFPYSIHNYELRYWLAAGGVDPDRDVRLTVAPPSRMVERLAAGELDGFCVGAPWNALAVEAGLGEIVLTSAEWWPAAPDKVFGVTRDWAERRPQTLQALLRALLRAAVWADRPENRAELAALLARPEHVGAPEALIVQSLVEGPDRIGFHRNAASFPWRSHARWLLSQMVRWGQATRSASFAAAAGVYAPELCRRAAADVGQPVPAIDAKLEGAHSTDWILTGVDAPVAMAADALFDGVVFDPAAPLAYVDRLPMGRTASEMGAAG